MRVIVLAERFPSLNQPWLDTYLEQLVACGHEPIIVTQHKGPFVESATVSALGLMAKTRRIGASAIGTAWRTVGFLLAHPFTFFQVLGQALAIGLKEPTVRRRAGLAIRSIEAAAVLSTTSGYALCHAHGLRIGHDFLAALRVFRIPFVLTFHVLEPAGVAQIESIRRDALFSQAAKVLVNTRFAATQVAELGCDISKIEIIPQGLPLSQFPMGHQWPRQVDEQVHVLSVGRFHRDKGQRYSLLALRRLRRTSRFVHWTFVGVGPDRERLVRFAERLGVEGSVSILTAVSPDELRRLYARSHIFVLASVSSDSTSEHVETQGVVLQEAQASGCAVVATLVGGIPECIDHGIDGLLVPERSHRAIADAVLRLLESPAFAERIARAGRQNVEDRFSSATIGRRMSDLLERLSEQET